MFPGLASLVVTWERGPDQVLQQRSFRGKTPEKPAWPTGLRFRVAHSFYHQMAGLSVPYFGRVYQVLLVRELTRSGKVRRVRRRIFFHEAVADVLPVLLGFGAWADAESVSPSVTALRAVGTGNTTGSFLQV